MAQADTATAAVTPAKSRLRRFRSLLECSMAARVRVGDIGYGGESTKYNVLHMPAPAAAPAQRTAHGVTFAVTASQPLEDKPVLLGPTLLHLTINTGAHSAKLNLPYSSPSYRTGPNVRQRVLCSPGEGRASAAA